MRVSLLVLAYALCASAQLVDVSSELVCPDSNPANCYPKVFVPSEEWKEIMEDQQIPAGLHVRMNMETGKREAKLMDDAAEPANVALVAQPNEDETPISHAEEEISNKIQETIQKYKNERASFARSKVSQAELNDFSSSVDEVLAFQAGSDLDRLDKALDTLTELSHDIEFGIRLSKNPDIFASLQRAAELASEEQHIVEKAYRIMGSALRNNPEAVENVLENQLQLYVGDLFRVLTLGSSDVIQKRVLGVIHALSAHRKFAFVYFNVGDANGSWGLEQLLMFFPKAGRSAKERIVIILEDLDIIQNLPTTHFDKRTMEMSVRPDFKMSTLLQRMLAGQKFVSEEQFQSGFRTLVDLHKATTLDPSKEFMEWLSEEAEVRARKSKDGETLNEDDKEFNRFMLEARHVVFGNPTGYRKAYSDEL